MDRSNNDVYIVLEGTKIAGLYHYKDDAKDHASAIGGTVLLQQIKYKLPVWVSTMKESSELKAKQQSKTI